MKTEDFKSIEGYEDIIEKLKTGYDDKVLCVSCPFSGNNSVRGGSCAYHGYSDGTIGKGEFDPRLKDSAIEFEKLKVVMEEKGDRYLVDEEFTEDLKRQTELEKLKEDSLGLNERIVELEKESNYLFRQKQNVWRKLEEFKEIATQNKIRCEKLTQENKKLKKENEEIGWLKRIIGKLVE